jgi:hypothetical protein
MTSTSTLGNSQSVAIRNVDRQQTRPAGDVLSGPQVAHLEARLNSLVGSQGTQALLERARHLSGEGAASREVQQRTLMELVRRLLGDSLAASLRSSRLR